MWRYWRALPPKGKIGIFVGSWYTDADRRARARARSGDAELDSASSEIIRFEKMLADEGALVLKFWFHLSKEQQKKRLKTLEKNPHTRWRVTKQRLGALQDLRRIPSRFPSVCCARPAPPMRRGSWSRARIERYRSLTVGTACCSRR